MPTKPTPTQEEPKKEASAIDLVNALDQLRTTYAPQIAEKCRAGLTDAQAMSVIKAQIVHDAKAAEAKEKAE